MRGSGLMVTLDDAVLEEGTLDEGGWMVGHGIRGCEVMLEV